MWGVNMALTLPVLSTPASNNGPWRRQVWDDGKNWKLSFTPDKAFIIQPSQAPLFSSDSKWQSWHVLITVISSKCRGHKTAWCWWPMLDIYLSYANFKICHFALLPALIWVRQGKVWLGTKMKLNPRVTLAVGQSSTFSCECIESSEQSSRPWAIIASEWSVSSLPAFSDGAAPRSGRWCPACYVWAWRASAWGWSGPGCCSLCWWCACSRALESSCILLCLGLTHWTWSTGGWSPWVEEVGVGRAWELVVVELCKGAACWSPGPHCPAPPLLGRAPAVCSCRTSHCSLAGGVSSTESRLWLVTTPGSDL